MQTSSAFPKIATVLIGLPVAAFALGLLLQVCIPGCQCDEGAGCRSCMGMEGFIAFLTFGGFVGAILGFIATVALAILMAIINLLSGSSTRPAETDPYKFLAPTSPDKKTSNDGK